MNWIGLVMGLAVALLVGNLLGDGVGGLVVLGTIGGALLMRLQKKVDTLAAEVEALKKRPAVSAAVAEATPMTSRVMPEPMPEPIPDTVPTPLSMPLPAPVPAVPRPAARPARVESDEHSLAITSSLGASLLAWFRGGNTIVRVAVLILFIGVAFLLRYAAERTTVPLELRLAGVALGGVALTVLGLRLTPKRRGYGLSLQGAGLGIVYLTLFAAYRLYDLLPTGLSFALLAAMAALTTGLALRQNALPLAALGFGGAFLAPILTSTGSGSHAALFSYYLLLNLAIAVIARRQAWKLLNLEGFAFTFGIGAAWGFKAYTPADFWSTEPFLIANFLLYLFITVQYTQRMVQSKAAAGLPLVDGSLLFGTPIVAFGLQAAMLHEQPLALAFSAAVLAGIYLLVGQYLWKQAGQRLLLLVEGLVALGLIFLALVTPLALDARWTSAAWAVQGLGVLWIGLRQRRWWAAAMGLLLQIGAALAFWDHAPAEESALLFFNSAFLGALLLGLAALASAWLLWRSSRSADLPAWLSLPLPLAQAFMLGLGLAQLWTGGWIELQAWPQTRLDHALLAAGWSALLALAFELGRARLQWPALRWPSSLVMLLALVASVGGLLSNFGSVSGTWLRYSAGLGLLEAALLLALGRWLLRRREPVSKAAEAVEHLSLAWYAMLQGGMFLYTLGAHFVARHEGWTPAAAILLPTLLALALISRVAPERQVLYRRGLSLPWLAALGLWVLAVNAFCDASMAPLPYLPLLNPLDLAHGLVLLYALRLALPKRLALAAAALAFWWLNALLIRTLHHWAGTPMWFDGALESSLVQTGLTVLWTVSALVTMLYATRRARPGLARGLWMAGAVLLGVVVVKLFLVDLSNLGSLMRIISFLAVGALMLVIGYVSPLPPATAEKAA